MVDEVCTKTKGLERNDEIPLAMDAITEAYVDAISDMAYLAAGDQKKVKALMLKNHKDIYARILGIYNLKSASRQKQQANILRGVR